MKTRRLCPGVLGVLSAVAVFGVTPGVAAQDSADYWGIGPVTGEVTRGFTGLHSVRELSDGRILLPDGDEEALYLVEFGPGGEGAVRQIGRRGEGPTEYLRPGMVFPIGRDSTLLVDGWHNRWSIVDGTEITDLIAGRSSGAVTSELSPVALTGIAGDVAVDVVGVAWSPDALASLRNLADSLALRFTQRPWVVRDRLPEMDTVRAGMVGSGPGGLGGCAGGAGRRGPGGSGGGGGTEPLCGDLIPVEDQAVPFADGWVAVAYVEPYRVRWRAPDGRWIDGPEVSTEEVPMTDLERCAMVQGWDFRGVGRCIGSDYGLRPLPERHPPFVRSIGSDRVLPGTAPVLAAPDGRLLVRRTPTSRTFMFTQYDVFDRTGARVGRIRLSGEQAILGFGERTVYTVWTDEVDLQWVRRHAWPPPGGDRGLDR